MPTWVFRGVVLPDGGTGELVSGSGATEVLPGRFALGGLVDAHCHLTATGDESGPLLGDGELAASRLAALARSGVGAVRDLGGNGAVTLHVDDRDGRPAVRAAGRFFAPPDRYFPRLYTPVDEAELVAGVHREIDAGASWVKLVADFPHFRDGVQVPGSRSEQTYADAALAAVVEAAHTRGVRVAAHCNTALAGRLVALGVDSIEHGRELSFEDLEVLGARGGAWTPTIGAGVGYDEAERDERARQRSGRLRDVLPYAVAVGVRVLAGSDVVGTVAQEVAAMVEHGLPVEDALRAASTAARDYLGVEGQDVVTYDRDPRVDPVTLREPAAVVLRGTRVR